MNGTGNMHDISAETVPAEGYVYFIKGGDAIKIGYSMNPALRLAQLQTGSSEMLELLGFIEGSEVTESDLHRQFKDIQKNGEWFYADDDLVDFIDHAMGRPIVMAPSPYEALSPEAQAMIGRLVGIRLANGADTPKGYAASMLAEQIVELSSYERPAWATHECQTLPWMIKQTMNRLEH